MSKDINLLPQKEILQGKDAALLAKLQLWGIVTLVAISAISMVVLIYGQILLSEKRDISLKSENLRTEIINFKDREIVSQLLKQKASGITLILNNRIDIVKYIDNLQLFLSSGVQITSLAIDDKGQLTIDASVDNSQTLSTLLTSLSPANKQNLLFKDLSVKSVSSAKDGSYTLTFNLKTDGSKK